ncbi:MAG TPA: hypothetical protein VFQ38_02800 [Longimicrobiales bacterium]|nr:hypothetical protein [Longimicrobiales bacterium]
MNRIRTQTRAAAGTLGRLLVVLGLVLPGAACSVFDDLLKVEAPSRIPEEDLDNPTSVPLLLNGAKADFECAYASYAVITGQLAGELMDATQTASRWPYTRRVIASNDAQYSTNTCAGLGIYKGLSTARFDAELMLSRLQTYTDQEVANRVSSIATAAAYSAYSHLLMGEAFCTGVLLDETLTPGGEATRQQLLQKAVDRFTQAIDQARASNNNQILNMALVGRARAYLDLGQKTQAATDAALVPSGFVYNATYSTIDSRRYNRVFDENGNGTASSVGVEYRNYLHDGVADPRVKVVDAKKNATDGTPIFFQQKYLGLNTPIPIASYDEAQLILAEATGGQQAVTIINAFHAAAGLPPFASTDAQTIQSHVIEERRAVLFLTGHRLWDVARFTLPRTPAAGTAFPKGGSYGNDTCFPLPDVEKLNNPKI